MSELTKNVQPLQDFDWEQFENGTTANVSKEELDKAYTTKPLTKSASIRLLTARSSALTRKK